MSGNVFDPTTLSGQGEGIEFTIPILDLGPGISWGTLEVGGHRYKYTNYSFAGGIGAPTPVDVWSENVLLLWNGSARKMSSPDALMAEISGVSIDYNAQAVFGVEVSTSILAAGKPSVIISKFGTNVEANVGISYLVISELPKDGPTFPTKHISSAVLGFENPYLPTSFWSPDGGLNTFVGDETNMLDVMAELNRLRNEEDENFQSEADDAVKDAKINAEEGRCFSAGTLIDMADGSQKPIEQIKVGDEVLSYDPEERGGLGALKPARVTRTMVNQVEEIIDFHGVKMTPGHATLCGDGPHQGQHIPIMDILVADGAIVNREGELIRAATNLPVGSEGDRFVKVAYILDKSQKTYSHGRIRIGTRMIGQDGGDDWRVMEALEREGYVLHPDGLISKGGETPHPLYWFGPLPKPEDYVLAKSRLTIGNLYSGQNVESSSAIGADLPRYAGMTVQ